MLFEVEEPYVLVVTIYSVDEGLYIIYGTSTECRARARRLARRTCQQWLVM